MMVSKKYNIFKGQMAKIFFGSQFINENMQKYTSTLEPHTKLLKIGLELKMRAKVLKAVGNWKVFSELKSKEQFLSKSISNGLLF